MKLSVLIPTYNRPAELRRGLEALQRQTRLPDEVVIAVRPGDTATHAFLADHAALPFPLIVAPTQEAGGFTAAINAGLARVSGDAVALTDDDTAPAPDWLRRIEDCFLADPFVGGVGGRDVQAGKETGTEPVVGVVRWWGKVVGNHHIGRGKARPVDVLKGCNCAYRTAPFRAVGFDTRLLGLGMQMHTEVALGLCFRRAGWKLIYDPALVVEHFTARRHDIDQRGMHFNALAHFNQSHNLALSLWQHFSPVQRLVYLLWTVFVGTRYDPGVLQMARLIVRDREVLLRALANGRGVLAAIGTASRTRRPETIPPSPPPITSSVAPAASTTAG